MAQTKEHASTEQQAWKYVDLVGEMDKELREVLIRSPLQAAQVGKTIRAASNIGLPYFELKKEQLRESQAGSAAVTAIQVGAALMVLREAWKYSKLAVEWFRT